MTIHFYIVHLFSLSISLHTSPHHKHTCISSFVKIHQSNQRIVLSATKTTTTGISTTRLQNLKQQGRFYQYLILIKTSLLLVSVRTTAQHSFQLRRRARGQQVGSSINVCFAKCSIQLQWNHEIACHNEHRVCAYDSSTSNKSSSLLTYHDSVGTTSITGAQ